VGEIRPFGTLRGASQGLAQRHHGARPQGHVSPSLAICCPEGAETLASALVRAALRAEARGFLHARMPPEHIARALRLVEEGEAVLPKDLLGALAEGGRGPDLSTLTARQLEILKLVAEGLANAQIAERLYLSESTVKQHLRAAYRLIGVKNRVQPRRCGAAASRASKSYYGQCLKALPRKPG
jgi:DNA-binding CsgD family transcriptional regulator